MQTAGEQLEIQRDLERVIDSMQRIQAAIKASRQPVSMLELTALKDLGIEYARLVEQLADGPDGESQV